MCTGWQTHTRLERKRDQEFIDRAESRGAVASAAAGG